MKTIVSTITAVVLCGGSFAAVQTQNHKHVIQKLNEATWGPAPPMLPEGAQIAVLAGNPTTQGPYSIRLKFPANYAIPAHSHPTDEHVVVISGALTFGMGDLLTKGATTNKTLTPGGFALMPANMNHFAYTAAQETTIVLYGQGPVEFKYVNSADDPRTAKQVTK
jgi:quercetin dioxygenase-like cupin family protein